MTQMSVLWYIHVKANKVAPMQPIGKVGRNQHKAHEKHKESVHSRQECHANDKVGHHMTN